MKDALRQQIDELTGVHRGLASIVEREAEAIVAGMLPFEASADGLESINEAFEIELVVPYDFPEIFPRVKETGGRITTDYEHRNPDGTLCLAIPLEQRRVFFEQPTLLGFINRLVIPYLYGYCFWERHGSHPFDEAAHGYEGILCHYVDALGLRDEISALRVICFLFEYGYRGHHECPCGSGQRVRSCHGPGLRVIYEHHTPKTVLNDFIAIFEICYLKFQKGEVSFPRPLRMQLIRLLNRIKS